MKIEAIIKFITETLKKRMEENLPVINLEIDEIILSGDKSVKKIEQILDMLLDYMNLNVGEEEFKRLNNYYSSFNKKNAEEYEKIYRNYFD